MPFLAYFPAGERLNHSGVVRRLFRVKGENYESRMVQEMWIELHDNLRGHKKTLDLADKLDIGVCHAVGILCCLWTWAITNADDGNLEGMSERSIARAIGWEGDPGVLVKALQDSHYLDGMQIHDWYDYAGKLLDARKKKSAMEVARQKAVKDAKDARDQKKAGEQLVGKLPASGEPVAGDLPSGDQGEGEGDPGKLPASDDPEVQVETPFGPVIVSRFTRVQNAYVEHVGGFPSPDMDEQLHFYYEKMGPDVVCEGIRRSVDAHPANVRSYMLKVLKAWLEAGVVDMEGVQRVTKKRDDEISRRKEAAKKFSEPKVPEEKPAKINWGDEG